MLASHRMRALLEEDLQAYLSSSLAEMHRRLGEELGAHLLRRQLLLMTRSGLVETTGGNRNRRYALVAKNQ
jgi:ATP-dependent DNA helicase RecG